MSRADGSGARADRDRVEQGSAETSRYASESFVRVAGFSGVVGAALLGMAIVIIGAIDPGYSVANDTISGLGTSQDPYALLFNGSLILAGALLVPFAFAVGLLVDRGWRRSSVTAMLAVTAVAIACVGGFPLDTAPMVHRIASDIVFITGGLTGVWVGTLWTRSPNPTLRPWATPSLIAGGATLVFVVAWYTSNYLGLGLGGGERLLVAPLILWLFAMSLYLSIRYDRVSAAAGLRSAARPA